MNQEVLKRIFKSTFIALSFFVLFIYSPLIYAQYSKADVSAQVTTTPKTSKSVTNNSDNSITNLLIGTPAAVNYLSIGTNTEIDSNNSIILSPLNPINSVSVTAPVSINTNTDVPSQAVENLSIGTSNVNYADSQSLKQSTNKNANFMQASLNLNRAPSFEYLATRISADDAIKLYILSIILFTFGMFLITNGWLFNLPSKLNISEDSFEISPSVILEQ